MATHTYTIVLAVPTVYVTGDFSGATVQLGNEALRLTRDNVPPAAVDTAMALTTCTGIVS